MTDKAPDIRLPDGTSHFGITVENLDRSLAFYRDLLGFEVALLTEVENEPYIEEVVGYPGVALDVAIMKLPGTDVLLEIAEYKNVDRRPVDTGTANPGVGHLCFYVDDLEALYRHLVESGVGSVSSPVEPTRGPSRGGRAVYLLDPDGIRVELVQTTRRLSADLRA